jgi:hypothetical protein
MAVSKRKRLAVVASLALLGFVPRCAYSAYGAGSYEPCIEGWIPGNRSEPGYDGHNVRPDGSLVDCVVVVTTVAVPTTTTVVIVPSRPADVPLLTTTTVPVTVPVVIAPMAPAVTNVPVTTQPVRPKPTVPVDGKLSPTL